MPIERDQSLFKTKGGSEASPPSGSGRQPERASAILPPTTLARAVILWERLWPVIWPAAALANVFLGLALMDVLPLLPGRGHAAVIALLAAGTAAVLARAAVMVRLPGRAEALRRLELDSGLDHRPLTTMGDPLAAGDDDPVAQALWQMHRRRVVAAVGRLRLRPPAPGLARHDPLGLRAAALLVLAVGVMVAWHNDPVSRLGRAAHPAAGLSWGPSAVVQLWITPPAYTGAAPVLLEGPGAVPTQPVRVPAGSAVLALLHGGHGGATLVVGERTTAFADLGEDSQRVEAAVPADSSAATTRRIAVRQGWGEVAAWPVQVTPDLPPSIAFLGPPQSEREGRLQLAFETADDYGVRKVALEVTRPDLDHAAASVVALTAVAGKPGKQTQQTWLDLTAHPWAGMAVTLTLVAEDAVGQTGRSGPVVTVLPQRAFKNPVAQALVDLRRALMERPDRRVPVIAGLEGLAETPDTFDGDTVVYLAMRVSQSRLLRDRRPEAADEVADLLWNAALRVEDGRRPMAQTNLDAALNDLSQALAEGVAPAEIEAMMAELRQALAEALAAYAEQAARAGADRLPPDQSAQVVTSDELKAMLDRLSDLARTGATAGAQQMLGQLQDMLDALRTPPTAPTDADRDAMKALEAVQDLANRQQHLMDQSFRQAQDQDDGAKPAAPPTAGVEAQEGLRRELGETMARLGDALGDIPPSLGQAEQAMRQAAGALSRAAPGLAAEAQGEAVAHLRDGARQAMQQLGGKLGGAMAGKRPGRRDPLGRPIPGPGWGDDHSVRIPDQAEAQKAREILDELRRRAGEPGRSPDERGYLDRLMKQF